LTDKKHPEIIGMFLFEELAYGGVLIAGLDCHTCPRRRCWGIQTEDEKNFLQLPDLAIRHSNR